MEEASNGDMRHQDATLGVVACDTHDAAPGARETFGCSRGSQRRENKA